MSDDEEASYGIDVEQDVDSLLTCIVEHAEELAAGAPPLGAVDREVAELHGHAARPPELDRFPHRVALVADRPAVRRVQGTVLGEDLGEGEHLVEVAVRARYVGEARAHAERALVERVRRSSTIRWSSAVSGGRASTPIAATRRVPCPASAATFSAMPSSSSARA